MKKRAFQFAIVMALPVLMCAASSSFAGEVLDRIVATVNGHIILQSDWQDAIDYECLSSALDPSQFTAANRKATLDRLIDQELLREQMPTSSTPGATQEQIAARLADIRKLYPGASTDEGWKSLLNRYGLTEKDVEDRIALEIQLNGLIDARLRPSVTIDSASIERYYSRELMPQLRKTGAGDVPLAEVTPKIKELLTQEKVSELLIAWLQTLRDNSDIRSAFASAGSADRSE